MKRILILCLTIVIFLTGCDISAWLESETPGTETPSTEMPSTETPSTEMPSTETPSTETPGTEIPDIGFPSIGTPSTETPKTELDKFKEEYPDLLMSETVTLGERLHKEDVAYILYRMTFMNEFGAPPLEKTYDVDGFFKYVIDKNLDKIMVTDIDGYDAYDKIMDDSWELIRKGEEFVYIYFYNSEGYVLGTMSIYPDNTIVYYGYDIYKDYVSVGKSEIDVNTFREAMLKGAYWKK